MIKGIIDRFEDDYVIVEIEGELKVISRENIPAEAREGDVLVYTKNIWRLDPGATNLLKKKTEARMQRLWK